jgi:lipoyl(octanoyl) transferase
MKTIDGRVLEVEWLGRVPYDRALDLQATAVAARLAGDTGDRLLLLEHPPVVTLGRNSQEAHLLESREALAARGVALFEVARGGDVTYHAPGQLIGYPILDLSRRGRPDVRAYLRDLESMLIAVAARAGLDCRRIEGRTGVFMAEEAACAPGTPRRPDWVLDRGPDRKLASIGVGLKRWVTCHGFALNVTTDLAGFEAIVPCGLHDVEMTSLARELGTGALGLDARVRGWVVEEMQRIFAA